ncbi:MAG: cell division protein FtsA [Alphaproteobacteria bacterium]|nr:cell division protein FtsA [Alphaproteobacteria bacterium]
MNLATTAAKVRPRGNGKAGGSVPPRPRQAPVKPRGSLIAGVDIGSSKICCFIARVDGDEPRILGIGHQVSRGLKSGSIIDLEEVGGSIRSAVHAAEEMADETIETVAVSLSGGFGPSRMVKAEINIGGREISDADMRHVLERGYTMRDGGDRTVIHSFPVGFSIDDSRGIRDPRGMIGTRLGVNMHIVTAAAPAVRNHSAAIARAMLDVNALVVSPYAAGLACLVEDETNLGVTLIDMGGGTTTVGVFVGGNLVFADSAPVGGGHVTNDIARGLSTSVAHAERLKALFGSAISSTLDEREMIAVPQIGEEEDGHAAHVPKSMLVNIIAPRIEETFEMVRNRLEAAGSDKIAGRRVVLTGGACQLHGVRELAGLILDKQVRIGHPLRIKGLAESTHGPAYSTAAGLLHFAMSERTETPRPQRRPARGLIGHVTNWLREFF